MYEIVNEINCNTINTVAYKIETFSRTLETCVSLDLTPLKKNMAVIKTTKPISKKFFDNRHNLRKTSLLIRAYL